MAIWPFNRNKQASSGSELPQEVQEYYQAEKRERVGIAGLLAFGTLVLTVVLAIGLFFGGRWLYRTVIDDGGDGNGQVAQQDQDSSAGQGDQNGQTGTGSQGNEQPPAPAEPAPAPASPDQSDDQAPATPAPTTPAPATPPTTVPSTAGDDLPNTGPAENVLVVLAVTAVSSLGFYRLKRPRV